MQSVAIIGGGPAGLMAAEVVATHANRANLSAAQGVQVNLYEAKPSVGRKFIVAGKGGLNLTHAEPIDTFFERYGSRAQQIRQMSADFGPDEIRKWCSDLGVDTFIGATQRVFPRDVTAAAMLNRWTQRLRASGVRFHTQHRWQGWNDDGSLVFAAGSGLHQVQADAVVLALGGASWPKLGSDGSWVPILQARGIPIAPLQPTNCGFNVAWSDHLRGKFSGAPLKSIVLKMTTFDGRTFVRQGSCVVTDYGLEGSLIYAASSLIRDELNATGVATITLDLAPDRSLEQLIDKLSAPRGSRSIANHLRRAANVTGVEASLLHELADNCFDHPTRLAQAIKALPVAILSPRSIDEAISTAGGIRWECLDESLMVTAAPGLFCAGEMLDWEAPTGGYLLSACFASGRVAGQGVVNWLLG